MRRRLSPFLIVIFSFVYLYGCATVLAPLKPAPIAEGSEALVVNSERALAISLSAFNNVVNFDHDNLAVMKSQLPQVHATIQALRNQETGFPAAYRSATAAVRTYKATRSKGNADAMNKAVADVQKQEQTARDALASAQAIKPT